MVVIWQTLVVLTNGELHSRLYLSCHINHSSVKVPKFFESKFFTRSSSIHILNTSYCGRPTSPSLPSLFYLILTSCFCEKSFYYHPKNTYKLLCHKPYMALKILNYNAHIPLGQFWYANYYFVSTSGNVVYTFLASPMLFYNHSSD